MGLLDAIFSIVRVLCGSQPQQEPEKPTPFPLPENLPAPAQDQRPPQQRPQQQQQEWPTPGEQQKPQGQEQWGQQKPHHTKHKPHHTNGSEQQEHGQTASPAHVPSTSPAPVSGGGYYGGKHVDQNLVNQQNPHYTSLRDRANEEGDAMARCFDESHQAYENKDGARAKDLSNEGKRHKAEMERLNEEASAWIFRENNLDSKPGEIDLHGLYVKEAIAYTDRSIEEARQRGDSTIHLIVGKGIHSANHAAKLKPAIEEVMQKHNLVAALDKNNSGVLIVQLDGSQPPAEQSREILGADDITRRLETSRGMGPGDEKRGDECVIM